MVDHRTIKPIETRYKGYRFRSRLEARWAVFFDALDIEWEYEKEGYDLGEAGWYLPDFWLPKMKAWVEVKPTDFDSDELLKCYALAYGTGWDVVLAIGQPECRYYSVIVNNGEDTVHAMWEAETEFGIRQDMLTYAYKESAVMIEDFVAFTAKPCPVTGYFKTGNVEPRDEGNWGSDEDFAVGMSRSARFEFGELPRV